MTPRTSSAVETGAATHPGTRLHENQDAYLDGTAAGIWAVADGMGGHDAGQFASHAVIEALREIRCQATPAQLLRACEAGVVTTNAELMRVAEVSGSMIGTTLAALLVHDLDYACLWAGDSRIYLVQDGGIACISRDHTEVQDLVDRGVLTECERRASPDRHVLTRAIGVSADVELEITQGVLRGGDTFLLCSDGLTNYVAEAELHAIVSDRSAQVACQILVDLALTRGGADNVTVVVVRFGSRHSAATGGPTIVDGRLG